MASALSEAAPCETSPAAAGPTQGVFSRAPCEIAVHCYGRAFGMASCARPRAWRARATQSCDVSQSVLNERKSRRRRINTMSHNMLLDGRSKARLSRDFRPQFWAIFRPTCKPWAILWSNLAKFDKAWSNFAQVLWSFANIWPSLTNFDPKLVQLFAQFWSVLPKFGQHLATSGPNCPIWA